MKAKSDFQKLGEVVEISGMGIPQLTAKLIKRTNKKAIYYRRDNVWEVFRIKINEAGELFGRMYPKREVYPCNEDFGVVAWCFRNEEEAMRRYNDI